MSGVFKMAKRSSFVQCSTNIPRDSLSQDVLEAKGKKLDVYQKLPWGKKRNYSFSVKTRNTMDRCGLGNSSAVDGIFYKILENPKLWPG